MNSIGVFCGSSMGSKPVYREAAYNLGRLLAEKRIKLVYGGSNIGLMKILANAVIEHGGYITGIMPEILVQKEIIHNNLSETHIVKDMQERKLLMATMSDGFITMPGGFGTLDELAEMLSWYQLEIHQKPTAIFNVNGFFDGLIQFLDLCVEDKFLRPEHRENIIISSDVNRIIEALINFRPVKVDSKWVDELKRNDMN